MMTLILIVFLIESLVLTFLVVGRRQVLMARSRSRTYLTLVRRAVIISSNNEVEITGREKSQAGKYCGHNQ